MPQWHKYPAHKRTYRLQRLVLRPQHLLNARLGDGDVDAGHAADEVLERHAAAVNARLQLRQLSAVARREAKTPECQLLTSHNLRRMSLFIAIVSH